MNYEKAILGFLLSLVFLVFFGYVIVGMQWVAGSFSPEQEENVFLGNVSQGLGNVSAEIKAEELIINAESAISVDSRLSGADEIVFEKNSNEKLPIASLTKLMTAIIVLDNYDLLEQITVSKAADLQNSLKQDVKLGDTLSAENFLDFMLIASSNKAAYALAEKIGEENFVSLMNKKAQELGLKDTFFVGPTGLSPGNISTASDLVKITKYILKNYSKIVQISETKEIELPNVGKITNTNELLTQIPEVIFGKTGFTAEAKGCLVLVVYDPQDNSYSINIILGAEDRFSEMKKMIERQNL